MAHATHYASDSKGPVLIADMNLRHAQNSLAKLLRDRNSTSRKPEIDALTAHVARLSEELAEQAVAR